MVNFFKNRYILLKLLFIIFLLNFPLTSKALTIKSGQVISSDGKVYNFASPKEKELLIKKSKIEGKSIGVQNKNLFLIIEEEILHIPIEKIIWSSDTQIINLVEKKIKLFFEKNDFDKNETSVKERLVSSAKKLKQLYLLNKLENKISKQNLNGNYLKFYFIFWIFGLRKYTRNIGIMKNKCEICDAPFKTFYRVKCNYFIYDG